MHRYRTIMLILACLLFCCIFCLSIIAPEGAGRRTTHHASPSRSLWPTHTHRPAASSSRPQNILMRFPRPSGTRRSGATPSNIPRPGATPPTHYSGTHQNCTTNTPHNHFIPRSIAVPQLPGIVENLTMELNNTEPSVSLKWRPPMSNHGNIISYEVRFKKTNVPCDYKIIGFWENSDTVSVVITKAQGLRPLLPHVFQVRAINNAGGGEWSAAMCAYIDWYCLIPNCSRSRVDRNSHIYEFCGKEHYKAYADKYCLYPQCLKNKSWFKEFCSEVHLNNAAQTNLAVIKEIRPNTREYRNLCEKFSKGWAPEKGPCPAIRTVLQIINPALLRRFESYKERLPFPYNYQSKKFFHGTKLSCCINEYLEICSNQSCGVCGIARKGFDREKIKRNRFQRFGLAFYLAPNSSKCHDYPLGGDANPGGYKAMLLCKVAHGKGHILHHNAPNLDGPPGSCHSVYGERSSTGDLNYDEIAIYDSDAICPLNAYLY